MSAEEILYSSEDYGKPSTELQKACRDKDLTAVQFCLESNQGEGINEKNSDEATPLHFACKVSGATYPSLALIEYLLEKGADVYMKDKYGHTPLDNIKREIDAKPSGADLDNLNAICDRLNKASIDKVKNMSMEDYLSYRDQYFSRGSRGI